MAHAQAVSYDEAVKQIATGHRDTDQPPAAVILFPDPQEEVIRLLDVTSLVPETGEFYWVRFGATPEVPFITEIAQVTPAEWESIQHGTMALPAGWDLAAAEEV